MKSFFSSCNSWSLLPLYPSAIMQIGHQPSAIMFMPSASAIISLSAIIPISPPPPPQPLRIIIGHQDHLPSYSSAIMPTSHDSFLPSYLLTIISINYHAYPLSCLSNIMNFCNHASQPSCSLSIWIPRFQTALWPFSIICDFSAFQVVTVAYFSSFNLLYCYWGCFGS